MLGHYMLNGEAGDPLELMRLAATRPGLPRLSISHDDYPHWKPVDEIVADKAAYRGKRVVFYQTDLELINIETMEKVWIGDKKIKKYVSKPGMRM